MKDNFMQIMFHCVSILGGVWFLSYSQSKCAMSDRAHEGLLEFQRDMFPGAWGRNGRQWVITDGNGLFFLQTRHL